MYSAVELKELDIKPKINDISLEVLREYYELQNLFDSKIVRKTFSS